MTERSTDPVAVLGTGMAGLGAAHRLGELDIPCVLYDEKPYVGGHTATFRSDDGFLFDEGPHVSYTKDERVKDLFTENAGGAVRTVDAVIMNHWKGHWIRHPAQLNLHGLPTDLVVQIITEMMERRDEPEKDVTNYEEWLIEAFGETFARAFPMKYNSKYQTTAPRNLTTDWLGPRVYRPKIEEVLRGAVAPQSENIHYITRFRYPEEGGFQSFILPFAHKHDVRLEHRVTEIDTSARVITFANGREARYSEVISSIPLPRVIPLIKDVPDEVRHAAERLSYSGVVLINVGVHREDVGVGQVCYFYDEDIVFSRLSFPHLLSPTNTPPGCSSIQAEVYHSKYLPLDRSIPELTDWVINDLRRCGVIGEDDEVIHTSVLDIAYANIIHDFDRAPALSAVHGHLDEVGVRYCGRYGKWDHAWTDEAFLSGEARANELTG